MARDGYSWGMRAVGPVAWIMSISSIIGGIVAIARVWALSPIRARVTVAGFLPGGPSGAVGGGGFDSGELLVGALPVATQVWSTVSIVSGVALWVWIALTVATVAASVRDGAGFTSRLPRALGLLGIAVLVFGIALQVSDQLAAVTLGQALYPPADGTGPRTVPASEFVISLDGFGWPLWIALAIGVLAFVLDRAARLQRDAAGLV